MVLKATSFRLNEELLERLRVYCESKMIPQAKLVEKALTLFLENSNKYEDMEDVFIANRLLLEEKEGQVELLNDEIIELKIALAKARAANENL